MNCDENSNVHNSSCDFRTRTASLILGTSLENSNHVGILNCFQTFKAFHYWIAVLILFPFKTPGFSDIFIGVRSDFLVNHDTKLSCVRGAEQTEMIFYDGPLEDVTVANGRIFKGSVLHRKPTLLFNGLSSRNYFKGLPTNVRAIDCYLGTLYSGVRQ